MPGAAEDYTMNGLMQGWRITQKCSLAVGVPVLLFLGLRIEKDDSQETFAQHALLAFALLTVILGLLAWGAYEELGLVWPGVAVLGFLAVFGSALFRLRPISREQGATAAGAPRGLSRNP